MIKNISNIFLVGMVAFFLSACDFLYVEKIGKSDIETYFSESTSLQTALYGTYNLYYSFYDGHYLPYITLVSDELSLVNSSGNIYLAHNYQLTSNEEASYVGYIWKYGYNTISNCNQIITHTEDLIKNYPNQEPHFRNVSAQAYFLRALTHFNLCSVYAQNYSFSDNASHLGVPVIRYVPSLTEKIARKTVKEVYDAVLEDLHTALPMYASDFEEGAYFASRLSTKALLARVYLYQNNYQKAFDYANELVNNDKFSLADTTQYVNMYCKSKELGPEAIFRLNGYKQSTGMPGLYNYERPEARPAEKLKSLYTGEDVRNHFSCVMPQTVGSETVMTTFSNVILKYTCLEDVKTVLKEDRYCNPFILRLSEMYLICAEALCKMNKTSEAESYLKAVVARSQGKDADDINLTWSGADELMSLIQNERFKELCFEGHRFLDLTRTHQSIERDNSTNAQVKKLNYPDYRMVLPISYIEMDANDAMTQNPDYE